MSKRQALAVAFPELASHFQQKDTDSMLKSLASESKKSRVSISVSGKSATLKGEKGDAGDKGEKGDDGKPGKDGKDGRSGLNGLNGKNGKDGKNGRDGLNGIDGLPGEKGKDGRDGKNAILPDEYETRLSSLEKSNTLKPTGPIDQRWHGGGLSKVSTDSTLSGLGTPASPLTVVSGGAVTIYNDTVSGTINGSNRVFTVPHTIVFPIALFLANSVYQSGVDYTVSGVTITMTTAPDSSLSGQPFFLAHS